jgi:hypothetical protein
MMEFSLTMPGRTKSDIRQRSRLELPCPPLTHAHTDAASPPLPVPRLDDHASSEPRCVLSPHPLRQTNPTW